MLVVLLIAATSIAQAEDENRTGMAERVTAAVEDNSSRAVAAGQTATGPGPSQEKPAGWFGKSTPLRVPPFVDQFRGIDLSLLSAAQRERFIQRANTEFCTCGMTGCPRHTLAHCQQVDPTCPTVDKLLRKILTEIAPAARTASDAKASPPSAPSPGPR
jgi:hypothetical protein